MAIEVDVRLETREVSRFLRYIDSQGVARATSRALNQAARQTNTEASKRIRQKRNLKARTIKRQLSIRKASPTRRRASVVASGRAISLKEYGARRKVVTRNGKRYQGATVEVDRGKRELVAGAFFGPGGHLYKRKGKARTPIRKLWGPSLPSTFLRDEIVAAMRGKVRAKYPGLLEHELRREFRRAAR